MKKTVYTKGHSKITIWKTSKGEVVVVEIEPQ